MWVLYALALVLGGGLLLVQLLGGAHHDGAGHFGGDHLGGPDHHPGAGPSVLSTRSLTYGLFAFGFVGASLYALRLVAPWAALAIAAAAAVAVTLAVGSTLRAVGDPAASGEAGLDDARGRPGRVLVALSRERPGKVRVQIKGQTVDVIATTSGADLPVGTEVVVVSVREDVAEVAAAGGRKP